MNWNGSNHNKRQQSSASRPKWCEVMEYRYTWVLERFDFSIIFRHPRNFDAITSIWYRIDSLILAEMYVCSLIQTEPTKSKHCANLCKSVNLWTSRTKLSFPLIPTLSGLKGKSPEYRGTTDIGKVPVTVEVENRNSVGAASYWCFERWFHHLCATSRSGDFKGWEQTTDKQTYTNFSHYLRYGSAKHSLPILEVHILP